MITINFKEILKFIGMALVMWIIAVAALALIRSSVIFMVDGSITFVNVSYIRHLINTAGLSFLIAIAYMLLSHSYNEQKGLRYVMLYSASLFWVAYLEIMIQWVRFIG